MRYSGVGGIGVLAVGAPELVAQSIRVAEPWTRQTRMAGIGLLLIVAVAVWFVVRVRRDG